MDDLMFPKPTRKKKRKKHKKSIIQDKELHYCFLCALLNEDCRWQQTEEHHVYLGINRQMSEANGFKVHICIPHHRAGKFAVHNNRAISDLLKVMVQRKYEKYHSREEFTSLTKRNYIWEDRDGFEIGQKVYYKKNLLQEENAGGEAYIYCFAWIKEDEKVVWLGEDMEKPRILAYQKDVTPIKG